MLNNTINTCDLQTQNEVVRKGIAFFDAHGNHACCGFLHLPAELDGFVNTGVDEGKIMDCLGKVEGQVLVFSGYQTITPEERICPVCGKPMAVHSRHEVRLMDVPRGGKQSILQVTVTKFRCPHCGKMKTQELPYRSEHGRLTRELEAYLVSVLALEERSISSIAAETGVCRNTIRDIDLKRLEDLYTEVNAEGKRVLKKPGHYSRILMIDEILLHKGPKFSTHIIDGETGEMLWAQVGKKKQVVYDFMEHAGEDFMQHVEAVACDMNSDFQEAFQDKYPHITVVFDHFHIIKHFNEDVLDNLRKDIVKQLIAEGKLEEAACFKRTKYLLMMNESTREKRDREAEAGRKTGTDSDTFGCHSSPVRGKSEERYRELINSNRPLFVADLIKEKLAEAYGEHRTDDGRIVPNVTSEEEMLLRIQDIVALCLETGIEHFRKFANMILSHIEGIVSYAAFRISSGKMEGINNRAKALRRISYGISDDHYFFLKLIDMTHSKIRDKESTRAHTELCRQLGYRRASKRVLVITGGYHYLSSAC